MSVIGDLRGIAKAGKDILSSNRRPLKQAEIDEAKTVFLDTVDYGLVFVADKLGYGNRPFTMLHKRITSRDEYTLYMGRAVYDADASLDWATFIHEMTHAWQGQNHWISSGYMWNSAVSQAIEGNAAYDYGPGEMWGEYNVEQQAHLVEDWYAMDGKSEGSPRFIISKLHPQTLAGVDERHICRSDRRSGGNERIVAEESVGTVGR